MPLDVLIDDVSGPQTAGDVVINTEGSRHEYGVFQVKVPGTGTVSLQGRTSPDMPWIEIWSTTISDAARVTLLPEMTASLAGHTGGAVRAELRG